MLRFRRFITTFPLKSDINITPSGKTAIVSGQGGRSSRTGLTATVFGATGFLGRLVVSKLAKHGTITMVPFRNGVAKRQLKVMGDLGVVNFLEFDLRNLGSIQDAVARSDIVINLIGTDYNTKNFSMADVNIEGARRIAEACNEANVGRFIHVSSYNADQNSNSIFYATKGIGERVVKDVFPDVTIVRPSPMYARNSPLINNLTEIKHFGTNVIFQKHCYPVHALQVAEALEKMAFDDSTMGKTYDLHGPEMYQMSELREMIKYIMHLGHRGWYPLASGFYLPAPEAAVKLYALFRQTLSSQPVFSTDRLTRVHIDQKIDKNCLGFEDLEMKPDELDDYLYRYVKPHIMHSSQTLNRTVYSKEDIVRLREFVNTPRPFFRLLNLD